MEYMEYKLCNQIKPVLDVHGINISMCCEIMRQGGAKWHFVLINYVKKSEKGWNVYDV